MTAAHKQQLCRRFPRCQNKVWTLGEFAGNGGDIADPFGRGMEAYRQAAAQIKQTLAGVIEQLKDKAARWEQKKQKNRDN